ncbi:ParB N-terminal domain-containing protein [Actinophytocola sediminis]
MSVPIASLRLAESPRQAGIDRTHVNALAETVAELPPIVVHRGTMRVIDGMHRVRAAGQNGRTTIDVRFFDGSAEAAFVLAVEANIAHGLPLTIADREAAASRIIGMYPHWSDRAIGAVSGLSAKTVAAIRARSTEENPQLNARLGRDGRTRPLSSVDGRRSAAAYICERPDASLREIARAAGISIGTARDVRERLKRGEDPVPTRLLMSAPAQQGTPAGLARADDRLSVNQAMSVGRSRHLLRTLQGDPSLRFTESGRKLLQWLATHAIESANVGEIVGGLPPHAAIAVADLARHCAAAWRELAESLEQSLDVTA